MWVIISVIVITIIFNNWVNARSFKEENHDKNNVPNESEAEKIYQEVEKRKSRAKDLGIDSLITKLYFDNIRYYPHWIKNGPDDICFLITNPTEENLKENDENLTKTKFILNNKEYTFIFTSRSFTTPDSEWHMHGDLELYNDGQRILAISLSEDLDEYSSTWRPFEIDAFIEGDWINDFNNLKKQIEMDEQQREIRERENPDKLSKLKRDFSIK